MSSFVKKLRQVVSSRAGFFWLVFFLFWLKTYLAYQNNFTLGVNNGVQQFLLLLNPVPSGLLLVGLGLYFGGRKSYWIELVVSLIQSAWLFANTLYYREFSDFLSFGIIKSSSSVSNNLGLSILEIIHPTDFLLFLDVFVLILLVSFKVIQPDMSKPKRRYAVVGSVMALILFGLNLSMAEGDRSQLLTRTFDNNYIVKYLGVDFFAGYSAYQTHQQTATRKNATSSDIDRALDFVNKNRSQPNISYYGKEKGKNVFILHLESFQQFLIDYKSDGQEVTPNINRFYHDQHTLAFDNFFNQVGQGKTSDAETMLETSLYGLPSGSSMTAYGSSNTYQALPAFLDQQGYATASMHGDVGSFWNRDNTYKSWGYQYFFDSSYYKEKANYSVGYGLKDKIFLKQSVKYLEQLPQPFYAKVITVTNHYPYDLDKDNQSIPKTKTGDKTVDGYVQTARYLDEAFGEFMNYLKKSGLYDNSVIVAYGDHYGISNNHPKALAKLLGKKSVTSYDLAMLQKVPFMVHSNNLAGGIDHTYGGEIDVMPTLMDLLGIKNDDTIQLGNDLLSTTRNQTVAFRNGDFVSPDLSKIGSKVYDNQGNRVNTKNLTVEQKQILKEQQERTDKALSLSDKIVTGDLLRFYTPQNFKKVDKSQYKYKYSDGIKALKKARKEKKTSLIDQHDGKSTQDLYETNAPELKEDNKDDE